MNEILMTAYFLVWPILVALMMGIMGRGVYRDARNARRKGIDLV